MRGYYVEQEFANPIVGAHLATYAEAAGSRLEDTRQGHKWLKEINPNLAGPMARAADGKDYLIHELVIIQDGPVERPVMIARWYEKDKKLVANVHPVRLTPAGDTFVVDACAEKVEVVSLDAFLLSVEQLVQTAVQRKYNLPAPSEIHGMH